jgi:hypothetical protein
MIERDDLVDIVDERIILKLIFKTGFKDIYWIQLVQNMDQWRALENTTVKLLIPSSAFMIFPVQNYF